MSRVGKKPVQITKGVTVTHKDGTLVVKGPKGELSARVHPDIKVDVKGEEVLVARQSDENEQRALHGLWRALVQNMILGVSSGYSKKLEIVGVGYRAEMKGQKLQLLIGYSHPILFGPPKGIKIEAPTQTNITISGSDKQLVGLVAAKIRSFRPPEPYKGKGIKYEGEYIRRKAGKAAATAGTGTTK
ncbi:MAG: 50S ribosomal protein L6 [Ignavibacteriales bacterium]|nr:50S ribosomal protein L6 [Ignavibacteriales bacterium]